MFFEIFQTIGMGLMGTFYSGIKANSLDIAPNYAGVIMAIGELTMITMIKLLTVNNVFDYLHSKWNRKFSRCNRTIYCWTFNSKRKSIGNFITCV